MRHKTIAAIVAASFTCGLILGISLHRRRTIEMEWMNKRVEWYNRELEVDLHRLKQELDSLHRQLDVADESASATLLRKI